MADVLYEVMILDKVTLKVQVGGIGYHAWGDVCRFEVGGCSEVCSEGALAVGADESVGYACVSHSVRELRLHACVLEAFGVEFAHGVSAYAPYIAARSS